MTDTVTLVTADRYATALDLARMALCQLLDAGDTEGFALSTDGRLLFHEQKIPPQIKNFIEPRHVRVALRDIANMAEMLIDEIDHCQEAAA